MANRYTFPPLEGRRVGQFIIGKQLSADGAMSAIYEATNSPEYQQQERRVRRVVLKIARNDDAVFDQSLTREVERLQSLRHPNIVHVFPMVLHKQKPQYWLRGIELADIFNQDAPFYYSMEWLKGGSLYHFLRSNPFIRNPSAEQWLWRIELAYQIAITLDYLHNLNIAHRDIKPDNVVFRRIPDVDEHPQPVLIDFGLWATGNEALPTILSRAGSLQYLSPERVVAKELAIPNQPVTETAQINHLPSDIWAFGIIIHELFYGSHPFAPFETEQELANKIVNTRPVISSQWEMVSQLVRSMLAPVREKRPTIKQVIYWLETQMGVFPPRI